MLHSRRQRPIPTPSADSTTAASTPFSPVTVLRTIGSSEYSASATTTGVVPMLPSSASSSAYIASDGTVRISPQTLSAHARGRGLRYTATPSANPATRADEQADEHHGQVLERQLEQPVVVVEYVLREGDRGSLRRRWSCGSAPRWRSAEPTDCRLSVSQTVRTVTFVAGPTSV